ncbi:uncharacterized protein BJ212DRAFT_1303585 [Suillus subaureus]|uniref:Uncharacterized protein n=1 Tax=Suillus subaureus TaxID=48587 RepID=A0A9P7E005_9AGAM|nr:uncharacterized protein BJ212DRAFT_1303585 [Suillus subaureus]KAG1807125.1 hypothetical protein BJ212DRAFT_1303585 [Suillus subaureus]
MSEPFTGRHSDSEIFDQDNNLDMGCNAVRGSGHRDIETSGTVTDNTELSKFPQANLPLHSYVTILSNNAIQTCHNSMQQQLNKSTVPNGVVYDVGGLSTLESDANHVTMMWVNSCLGTLFVVVNGMMVIPDGVDEMVNGVESTPIASSCTEDEWYHILQAVVTAASVAS